MNRLLAFVAMPLLLLGCAGSGESGRSVGLGEAFTLKPGESVRVGDHLRLTFEKVTEDSRCPVGVECVSEGNARVHLEYISPDHPPLGIFLNTMRSLTRDTTVQRYHIALVSLVPQPRSGVTMKPEEYRAELVVKAP